jgi:hypothetical protein
MADKERKPRRNLTLEDRLAVIDASIAHHTKIVAAKQEEREALIAEHEAEANAALQAVARARGE